MPIGSDTIRLDQLTADPSTPDNGDIWYNATTNTVRARVNGTTVDAVTGGGSAVFGQNYQTVADETTTTTTSSTFQTKVTLTTPALTGAYLIQYYVGTLIAGNNKYAEVRLYNTTDASELAADYDRSITGNTSYSGHGGFAFVTFTGVAKSFAVQFRSLDNTTQVSCRRGRIAIWRVV